MLTPYVQEDGSRVEVNDPFGYFRDALACYQVGAYRASLGEIYNAVFNDVYNKLSNFTEVNRKEKYSSIFHRAENSRNARSPFEKNLAEELGKVGFLTEEQCEFLDELRVLRNDASHPIGWDAPAGKTNYILRQAVSLFLAQPSLSPSVVREEILSGLHGLNYFASGNRNSRRRIVEEQIARVIPAAYHLLIKEIAALWRGQDEVARRNSGTFFQEAICLDNELLRKAILVQFIEPLLVNPTPDDAKLVAFMVRLAPTWTKSLNAISQQKLARALLAYVEVEKGRNATALLEALHDEAPELLDGPFRLIARTIIEMDATAWSLPNLLGKSTAARTELLNQYRLQSIGRDRERMLKFLNDNAARIVHHLSGAECYALVLVVSGREIVGTDPMEGIGALLLPRAANWFYGDAAQARKDAQKTGLYDPANWFVGAILPTSEAQTETDAHAA